MFNFLLGVIESSCRQTSEAVSRSWCPELIDISIIRTDCFSPTEPTVTSKALRMEKIAKVCDMSPGDKYLTRLHDFISTVHQCITHHRQQDHYAKSADSLAMLWPLQGDF